MYTIVLRTTAAKTGNSRDETLNLRATQRQKALIDRAADAPGRNRSDFMLETACQEAEAVLLDRQYFALHGGSDEGIRGEVALSLRMPNPSTTHRSR